MHDNFEKEVQKKLEELNLVPSPPVWEKVELEIRPEKKKRRVFFWLFFGALLLTFGMWTGYHNLFLSHAKEGKTIKENITYKADKNVEQKTNLNKPVINNSTTNYSINDVPGINQEASIDSTSSKIENKKIVFRHKTISPLGVIKQGSFTATDCLATITNNAFSDDASYKQNKIEKRVVQDDKVSSIITTPKTVNAPFVELQVIPTNTLIDSSVKKTDSLYFKTDTLFKTSDTASKKGIAKTLKKWRFGATAAFGFSSYASGIGFGADKVMRDAAQSIGGSVSLPSVPVILPPSAATKGFAFSIGAMLNKNVGRRWTLSVGLQYSYYSTNMQVGSPVGADTAFLYSSGVVRVQQFFTNTASMEQYTNKFHTIKLPVGVAYQLHKKAPLYLWLNAAYGRVIATNGLTYSSTLNVYYKSKKEFNQNLVPVSLALQYRFKGKRQLEVGPMIEYNLLSLRKPVSANAAHLFFAGLKTALVF